MENPELEPVDEYSREDLDQAFRHAVEAAERAHRNLSEAVKDAGMTLHFLELSHPNYVVLFDKSKDDPSIYPVVASGINYLKNLTITLTNIADETEGLSTAFGPLANSTGTFSGSSGAAMYLSGSEGQAQIEGFRAPFSREDLKAYSSKLNSLDPALADTYDQVWETYYETRADRYRA